MVTYSFQRFGCQSAISSVSINLNTNITELYSKRSTVFKFGCFEVDLSRSGDVFFLQTHLKVRRDTEA